MRWVEGELKDKKEKPIRIKESNLKHYYFDKDFRILSDKVAKLGCKVDEISKGLVIDRLSRVYANIFIDEVQDLAGYDLDIIKLMAESKINLVLVGDPRQVTFQTNHSNKNKKYNWGRIKDYVKNECRGIEDLQPDEETLNITHRNGQKICEFANRIYEAAEYKPYGWKYDAERDEIEGVGVFLVRKQDGEYYLKKYPETIQLTDDRDVDTVKGYRSMNFGASKGLSFRRVLIYVTKPIQKWLGGKKDALGKVVSRSKFYIAVTRAICSVAIVVDDDFHSQCGGVEYFGDPKNPWILDGNLFGTSMLKEK